VDAALTLDDGHIDQIRITSTISASQRIRPADLRSSNRPEQQTAGACRSLDMWQGFLKAFAQRFLVWTMAGRTARLGVGFRLAIVGRDKEAMADRIALATTGFTPFPR
jgi:hypothetical protein